MADVISNKLRCSPLNGITIGISPMIGVYTERREGVRQNPVNIL